MITAKDAATGGNDVEIMATMTGANPYYITFTMPDKDVYITEANLTNAVQYTKVIVDSNYLTIVVPDANKDDVIANADGSCYVPSSITVGIMKVANAPANWGGRYAVTPTRGAVMFAAGPAVGTAGNNATVDAADTTYGALLAASAACGGLNGMQDLYIKPVAELAINEATAGDITVKIGGVECTSGDLTPTTYVVVGTEMTVATTATDGQTVVDANASTLGYTKTPYIGDKTMPHTDVALTSAYSVNWAAGIKVTVGSDDVTGAGPIWVEYDKTVSAAAVDTANSTRYIVNIGTGYSASAVFSGPTTISESHNLAFATKVTFNTNDITMSVFANNNLVGVKQSAPVVGVVNTYIADGCEVRVSGKNAAQALTCVKDSDGTVYDKFTYNATGSFYVLTLDGTDVTVNLVP